MGRHASPPDWPRLQHAYGPAGDVPELIERAAKDPEERAWHDVWSCLCHQESVYPASYAALPLLFEVARDRPPARRIHPLLLIGAIIASDKIVGLRERPWDAIEPLLPRLRRLTQEALSVDPLDRTAFIYLLQAASAFHGDLFWGRYLSFLADGEFPGRCPGCGRDLHLVIGQYGFFGTTEDWVRKPEMRSDAIVPADQSQLSERALWLFDQAVSASQGEVAEWIRYLFGQAVCPACEMRVAVESAIAARLA
jgi:hypothetical protein